MNFFKDLKTGLFRSSLFLIFVYTPLSFNHTLLIDLFSSLVSHLLLGFQLQIHRYSAHKRHILPLFGGFLPRICDHVRHFHLPPSHQALHPFQIQRPSMTQLISLYNTYLVLLCIYDNSLLVQFPSVRFAPENQRHRS